jgi:hypothetical protein
MILVRRLGVSLALVVALAAVAWAQSVSVDTLLREATRFDNRPVLVSGTVTMVESPQAFQLLDRGSQIRVVTSGGLPVNPGQRVEVEGVFKLGPRQIEALRVSPR